MQIVIEIPDKKYEALKMLESATIGLHLGVVEKAIIKGTPLPKGHGRLGDLDALYREIETKGWFDSDDAYYGGGLEDIVLSASTLIEADKEVDNADSN